MAQCDICNTSGIGTIVSSSEFKKAIGNGFNPFKSGLTKDLMASMDMNGFEIWKKSALYGAASNTDWNICPNCMEILSKFIKIDSRTNKLEPGFESFTDLRDGKTYKTKKIGNQIWMAENLNFVTKDEVVKSKIKKVEYETLNKKIFGIFPKTETIKKESYDEVDIKMESWYYDNDPKNGEKFGRLYTWETAKIIAPDGWHLPTKTEWESLYRFLGGNDSIVYGALKEGGSSGLNLLLGGHLYKSDVFFDIDENALFWSATACNEENAWYFFCGKFAFNYTAAIFEDQMNPKSYGLSVRLIKD